MRPRIRCWCWLTVYPYWVRHYLWMWRVNGMRLNVRKSVKFIRAGYCFHR